MPTQRICGDIKIISYPGIAHHEPTLGTARTTLIGKRKNDNLAVIAKESDHASMSNSVGSIFFLGQLRIQNIEKKLKWSHVGYLVMAACPILIAGINQDEVNAFQHD